MEGNKYVVFKVDDFERIALDKGTAARNEFMRSALHDAVVIRRQDMFAPPALHSYANSIAIVARLMIYNDPAKSKELQSIADYFHEQATLAEAESHKIPD